KSRGGDMTLPVTYLLKNATKFISINAAFFNIFFTIKDLPYITVLDENNYFFGILTHNRLLKMLSRFWNVELGIYVLTFLSNSEKASCMYLGYRKKDKLHRTLFTLPSGIEEKRLNRIVTKLKRRGFEIEEIEDLSKI